LTLGGSPCIHHGDKEDHPVTSIKLPGLWLPTVKGKQYAYYRPSRNARPIRLRGEIGSREFLAHYQELVSAAASAPVIKAPAARSLDALIASYKASERWKDHSDRTRYNYEQIMRWMQADGMGGVNMADFDRVDMIATRDHFAGSGAKRTPAKANQVTTMISILIQHAINIGWRKDNPCVNPQKLKQGPGIRMWKPEEFHQFISCEAVSEPVKRAAVLAYYTGLRVSDLVALPRVARAGGLIRTATQKTGAEVAVAEHPELTRWLDAAPASISPTLLTMSNGKPWRVGGLQRAMLHAAQRAGLPGLTFHGLRKGLTGALAEHGATDAEIEAVIPHADPKMTAYYRRQANQTRLAAAGIAKLSDRRG
jgi:integrase